MGEYPTNNQGLNSLIRPPMDLKSSENWRGPYYAGKQAPKDPWDNVYVYERLKNGGYSIRSVGPDGEPNTADDIVEKQEDLETPSAPRILTLEGRVR